MSVSSSHTQDTV